MLVFNMRVIEACQCIGIAFSRQSLLSDDKKMIKSMVNEMIVHSTLIDILLLKHTATKIFNIQGPFS